MGGTEILLIAAVIVIPLAIAVAVTLWTLEPAAQRAERANRGRKRASSADLATRGDTEAPHDAPRRVDQAEQDDRTVTTR